MFSFSHHIFTFIHALSSRCCCYTEPCRPGLSRRFNFGYHIAQRSPPGWRSGPVDTYSLPSGLRYESTLSHPALMARTEYYRKDGEHFRRRSQKRNQWQAHTSLGSRLTNDRTNLPCHLRRPSRPTLPDDMSPKTTASPHYKTQSQLSMTTSFTEIN